MKKGGFLRNVLDTIRSNPTGPNSGSSSSNSGSGGLGAADFGGQLKPQHFALTQVARHGFPESPTALAFDPVQKIAAIGTKTGALRVFGRPGVDVWAQHKPECAVTHIKFIINQGAIITVTADDSIHLWSLRGPNLKLQLSAANSAGASSPCQLSHSPVPGSGGGGAPATAIATHKISDTGAQPGDPDYLSDVLGGQSSASGLDGQSGGAAGVGGKSRESRRPEILHTLKFQRERITCLHQTLMSKWLYIGTEKGNVHVANVETFELSGYTILWNKAIELSRKTHPGAIIHISECPQDTNKLLIGFECGLIVLWDLKQRGAEARYYQTENLLWLAWHYEGKQFVAAHGDGSLVTWHTRSNERPAQISHPHAKSANPSGGGGGDLASKQQSMASTFARAFNNELYRPINKVEWKTSKTTNENFILFSGGLPYDGLAGGSGGETGGGDLQRQHQLSRQSMGPSPVTGSGPLQVRPNAMSAFQNNQQQQHPKASSVSPNFGMAAEPSGALSSTISPSLSPSTNNTTNSSSSSSSNNNAQQAKQQVASNKEKRSLKSTSLTVMYGKSITVLEMDETIIDFITVCDLSPYENDASDPFAVLVLLSNDLILIDLTSSGYPSFESPYPAQALNESPVTCVQYLADCSSDLIPFLYSTSQNVVSRAPKKGFSDKEWPINGGEWGQPMQSYPELVITGHLDGTIKFWDMSGVNFDLITKIKTSKLFERPNKLPNSLIVPYGSLRQQQHLQQQQQQRATKTCQSSTTPGDNHPQGAGSDWSPLGQIGGGDSGDPSGQWALGENCFAIERIEYCAATRHLLVAGALSQVIQFKLNKKDSSPAASEVIIIDPLALQSAPAASQAAGAEIGGASLGLSNQSKRPAQHLLLRARSLGVSAPAGVGGAAAAAREAPMPAGPAPSATGAAGGAASRARPPLTGFHADLVCLTPLLVAPQELANFGSPSLAPQTGSGSPSSPVVLVAPPRVTALAVQAQHNILAYAHEQGVVLVDLIQKCVIMNASLSDLYGTMSSNRDTSVPIQPFATSSILQHHYQSTAGAGLPEYSISASQQQQRGSALHNSGAAGNAGGDNGGGGGAQLPLTKTPNTAASAFSQFESARNNSAGNANDPADNGPTSASLYKSAVGSGEPPIASQPPEPTTETATAAAAPTATTAAASEVGETAHAPGVADAGEQELEQELQQQQQQHGEAAEKGGSCEPTNDESRNRQPASCSPTAATSGDAHGSGRSHEQAAGGADDDDDQAGFAKVPPTSPPPPPPPPKARLLHAKSVVGASDGAQLGGQPVAPPRTKKRQSVPTVVLLDRDLRSSKPTTETASASGFGAPGSREIDDRLSRQQPPLPAGSRTTQVAQAAASPRSSLATAADSFQAPTQQQHQQQQQPGTISSLFTRLMAPLRFCGPRVVGGHRPTSAAASAAALTAY